ncbi:hypothetical protein NA57DRAFT_18225, partial [Rhizodiscina lignyota]
VIIEVFGAVGAPARLFGRLPLITRYLWSGLASPWFSPRFARNRFGKNYQMRPWLLFDMQELQMLEELINKATDQRVQEFRQHQLESLNMVSVVSALVSGIGLTALQLPGMESTSYLGRGCFCVSTIIALLATFFTCLQQRTYGFIEEPGAIRAWLSNGVRYLSADGIETLQSSVVSHNLLQAPFELLCISITTFLLGFGVHLGSAYVENVPLGVEESIGNRGVLIAFCIGTAFALGLLGQVLGGKDVE